VTIEVVAVTGIPEIAPGDDLPAIVATAVAPLGVGEGDVVVVTQKVVSKAEGRVIAGGARADAIASETERIVAVRGDLVIAQTRHGFVCANAGVDASNVPGGALTLLPTDPDGSAAALREAVVDRLGVRRLGVIVTDTFGRPWREGLVDVAIGVAGMPGIVDLRGTPDRDGRELEATVVALADQIASWVRPTGFPSPWSEASSGSMARGARPISFARPGTICSGNRRCRPCTRVARSGRSARAPWGATRSKTRSPPPAPRRLRTTRDLGPSSRWTRRRRSGHCSPRSRRPGEPISAATAHPRT
jgi:coenzyme F420-0:L-glutamate ligase